MKIKYDNTLIKFISFFESMTRVSVKDCFVDGNKQLLFVVPENEVSKAIGDRGFNVKKIENALKRRIKIVGYNPELPQFVENLIHPLKAKSVSDEDGVITIESPDSKTRGMLIGRNAQNLRNYESIAKRYFELKEIKVV